MANNYTFNAAPFKELIDQSTNLENSICDNLAVIANKCQYMSEIVSSEDSTLSEKWSQFAYSLGKPTNSIKDIFETTKKKLQEYVDETIANEKAASIELEELDSFLAEFATMTDSLSGLSTAVVGTAAGLVAGTSSNLAQTSVTPKIETYDKTPVVYGPAPDTGELYIDSPYDGTPVLYGPAPISEPIRIERDFDVTPVVYGPAPDTGELYIDIPYDGTPVLYGPAPISEVTGVSTDPSIYVSKPAAKGSPSVSKPAVKGSSSVPKPVAYGPDTTS